MLIEKINTNDNILFILNKCQEQIIRDNDDKILSFLTNNENYIILPNENKNHKGKFFIEIYMLSKNEVPLWKHHIKNIPLRMRKINDDFVHYFHEEYDYHGNLTLEDNKEFFNENVIGTYNRIGNLIKLQ